MADTADVVIIGGGVIGCAEVRTACPVLGVRHRMAIVTDETIADLYPVHVHYIQEITRLHLWYADRVLREEGVAFSDAMNGRVNI